MLPIMSVPISVTMENNNQLLPSTHKSRIQYSQKIWRELNLADCLQRVVGGFTFGEMRVINIYIHVYGGHGMRM